MLLFYSHVKIKKLFIKISNVNIFFAEAKKNGKKEFFLFLLNIKKNSQQKKNLSYYQKEYHK